MSQPEDKNKLISSIIKFLQSDNSVDQESIAVAVQVISDTYNIDVEDKSHDVSVDLQSIFNAGLEKLDSKQTSDDGLDNDPKFQAFIAQLEKLNYFKLTPGETRVQKMQKAKEKYLAKTQGAAQPSAASLDAAEKAKDEGNELLKQKKPLEAIEAYKRAIGHNPRNAVYPCNMAAAYINLKDSDNAIKCCNKAIEIDVSFHRAYSRLGSIYDRKGKLQEALEQYELALKYAVDDKTKKEYKAKIDTLKGDLQGGSLDGSNIRNQQLPNMANMFGGGGMPDLSSLLGGGAGRGGGGMPDLSSLLGGAGGAGGMPDIGSLLSNPNFMNTVTQMMQQPGVQEMMSNMMQNMGFNAGAGMGQNEGDHRAAMEKILSEPEVRQSPKLTRIFTEARDNGMSVMAQYVSDPDVSQFMMSYAQRNMNPQDSERMRDLAGSMDGDKKDDNDNNNMYS
ncbi:glutamine-rich tetratricopeptide repeat-containing protein [Acrasis kona]|uniref:Glutamine-rich tetratricopeptide repeat-containing protein n=1 Tax=Acrasis kona TaxID=1008807 RepID=A0AAW2YNV3_9EUKA